MTPLQYRSGYTTMILNNVMSAPSVSTNCEPDNSFGLLNDVHDLILNHISNVNPINTNALISETDDLYDDIVFDPQFTKRELNFFESESLNQVANVVCSKLLERNYCNNCLRNLQVEVEPTKLPNLQHPSSHFIKIFKKIFDFALQFIPIVATEKSLKKFIIEEIKKRFKEEAAETKKISELTLIGCVEHNQEIVNKLFELTTIYAIKIFCININGFLTGKIKELLSDPSDLQVLARTFWLKKTRIGKHSDIFKT